MNKEEVSVGITGFIDILGFGDKVLNAHTVDDINNIQSDIKKIQSEFNFNTNDELTLKVQTQNNATVLAFSDCVVINIPLQSKSTEYSGTFDPIMNELANFAYAQGKCVQNSLFLRGGLELGWWFQKASTLISKSMVGAVKKEASADVPVIALCEKIYSYFSDHKDRNYYSKDNDPMKDMFRKYQSGENKFYYIDYISICIEALDWHRSQKQMNKYQKASKQEKQKIKDSGYRQNIDEWLSRHAKNIEKANHTNSNVHVKKKYEWLAFYHNEIAKKHSTSSKCLCKL